MLKQFAEYLVGLKDNKTYYIHGDTYADHALHRIAPHIDRPERLAISSLDGIVQLVKSEMDMITSVPIYIHVAGPCEVSVFTSYDDTMTRDYLYRSVCDVKGFRDGFRDHASFIIELQSKFMSSPGTEYLLELLSRISTESTVTSADNGVSQTVEARQGISMKANVAVKPRIALTPYRTFLEAEQPMGEFLLRLDEHGRVGLFEADGGMWQMTAKANIVHYFSEALADEIATGTVVVMM